MNGHSIITLNWHDLRGGSSNRAFHPVHGRIACGSMVRVYLVHKKIHSVNFFVNKKRYLPPGRSLP
jgi:hypothetical protein